jgi:outer membrane protein assembly factor BamD (BamD/ComL family)
MASELQLHKKRFFALAMRLERMPRALALYRELAAAGDSVVLAAADVLPLAKAADKAHDTKLAIELVRGFDKRFPGHVDIPAVYLFSAGVASERLRKDDLARSLLKEILRRYPGHELAGEAARYLEVIDRLAAPKPNGAG